MSLLRGKARRAAFVGSLVAGLGLGTAALVGALSGQQPAVETVVPSQAATGKAERVKGPKKTRPATRITASEIELRGLPGNGGTPETRIVVSGGDAGGVAVEAFETLTEDHVGAIDVATFKPTQPSGREAEAARLAEEARKLSETPDGRRSSQYASLRERVAVLLGLDFDARQEIQETEARMLRERLAKIEKQLDNRRKLRGEIIARRADELFDPDLKWNVAAGAAGGEPRDVNVTVRRAPNGMNVREATVLPRDANVPSSPAIPPDVTRDPSVRSSSPDDRTIGAPLAGFDPIRKPLGSPVFAPPAVLGTTRLANPNEVQAVTPPAGTVVARDAVQAALARMAGSAGPQAGVSGLEAGSVGTLQEGAVPAIRSLSPLDVTRVAITLGEFEEKLSEVQLRSAANVAPPGELRLAQQRVDALRGELAALQALQTRAVETWTGQLRHTNELLAILEKSAAEDPGVDWPELRAARKRKSDLQRELDEMGLVLKMLERIGRKSDAAAPKEPGPSDRPPAGTAPATPAPAGAGSAPAPLTQPVLGGLAPPADPTFAPVSAPPAVPKTPAPTTSPAPPLADPASETKP